MKETLRNLALGAAVLTAGAMFAEGPTVTVNFSQKITTAEIATLADGVRVAAGANGYVYALNKATGEVLAINGDGIKVLDKKFAPVLTNDAEETIASLNTAITTDDAGNIIVLYANGGFWANAPYGFGIMPADGGDIIYTDKLVLPEGYTTGRLDVVGRVVGNVLEQGALFLAPCAGQGVEKEVDGQKVKVNAVAAGFVFEEGVPTAMEYCSTVLTCTGQNLNVAVPSYNSIDELMDADAMYDAMYVQQWNAAANYYYVVDAEALSGTVPVPEGGAVGGAPGFDVINRDGEMYFLSQVRTKELNPDGGSRCCNFQLTDAEGNVLFTSDNVAASGGTTFLNGGGLFCHQVSADKYEVYFWGGPKESVYATMATINFGEEEPAYEAPAFGIRGEFNGWSYQTENVTVEGPDADGNYVYTAKFDSFPAGEFKFGTDDWKTSFGAGADKTIVNGESVESWENGQNFVMPEDGTDVVISLIMNPDFTKASKLFATWVVPVEMAIRAPFAYNLASKKKEDNTYKFTFNSTQEGTASLVLTNANNEIVKELGRAAKGENEFDVTFETTDEAGNYNWAIRVESENDATAPEFVVKDLVNGVQFARGGVVVINDPEYDSFGYTAVGAGRANGIAIYTPEGELVTTLKGGLSPAGANNLPMRGGERFGKAVFPSWGDATSGYYYVDPLNPSEELDNILVGERASNGLFTYEGVQTAGGSPCVAFLGKGDEQTMWLFEEDLFKNTVAVYPIGTAERLTVAGEALGWTTAACASQNMSFTPTEYGMFVCQNRGSLFDAVGVPSLLFIAPDGKKLAETADFFDESLAEKIPNVNGGFAISADLSLIALCGYHQVNFLSLEWEEQTLADYDNEGNQVGEAKTYMVPSSVEFLYSVECSVGSNLNNGQAMFDAANNLHYYAAATGDYNVGVRYAVITLPGQNVANTPAKSTDQITITTGVALIEAAADADAVYYNINGVRVAPENLTTGVYVKVQGDKAQKVIVK